MGLIRNEADGLPEHGTGVGVTGLCLLLLPLLSGCHSAYVQADIHNASGQPISLLELDYPSASFGVEALAAGADYKYRFKIIGDGPTKVLWTDFYHKEHSVPGPTLHEGQEGMLQVTITETGSEHSGPAATDRGATGNGQASTAGEALWSTKLQP